MVMSKLWRLLAGDMDYGTQLYYLAVKSDTTGHQWKSLEDEPACRRNQVTPRQEMGQCDDRSVLVYCDY